MGSLVERIADALVGKLAVACIVDVAGEDGALRRKVAVHMDVSRVAMLEAVFPPEDDRTPIAGVLETARAIVWVDLTDAPRTVQEALSPLGVRSVLCVPAISQGHVFAVMTLLADVSGARFDAYDLAVARDVAARLATGLEHARAYRSVRQAVTSRDDLVAVVSHDLRDPLSAIGAGVSVLRLVAPAEDATLARAIELVERNVGRMQQLVGNLLDLARHDSAGLPLDLGRRAPRGIIYEALETLGPLAAQKRVQLEARMPAELPDVRCDRHATVRVLTNLLGNAIKYTPPGGAIRVRVEPLGGDLRIAVSDTGPGIPRAELPHVFDRYWQARSALALRGGPWDCPSRKRSSCRRAAPSTSRAMSVSGRRFTSRSRSPES